ncbi:MAG: hypothetical protein M5U30_16565 [Burkholderiaceae bacterium]|nr:hypothetical protein [Burkholderiaceae bacterium]
MSTYLSSRVGRGLYLSTRAHPLAVALLLPVWLTVGVISLTLRLALLLSHAFIRVRMERVRMDLEKAKRVAIVNALAYDAVTANVEELRAEGIAVWTVYSVGGRFTPAAIQRKRRALPACIRLTPTRSTGSVTFPRRPAPAEWRTDFAATVLRSTS